MEGCRDRTESGRVRKIGWDEGTDGRRKAGRVR